MQAKFLFFFLVEKKKIQSEHRHNRGAALCLLSLLCRDPSRARAITIDDSAGSVFYPVIINNAGFSEINVRGAWWWVFWAIVAANIPGKVTSESGMFGVCMCTHMLELTEL